MDADPEGTQSVDGCREEHVLNRGGTVLRPPFLELTFRLSAHYDGHGSRLEGRGIGMKGRDGIQDLPVLDDHEMPGLLVRG